MNDLRCALRILARNPGSTLVMVALLGIGLGASATIFSLFDAILLRPLPVQHPEQLVRMVQRVGKFSPQSDFPYACYAALVKQASNFQFILGETGLDNHFRMTQPSPGRQVTVSVVTPEYFKALGVSPYWGRALMPDDAAQGSNSLPAVLSYRFWKATFAADPAVLPRQKLVINGHRFLIVGVMPGNFNGLSVDTAPDIRVPLAAYPLLTGSKTESASFELAGRLKPTAFISAAESQCLAIWTAAMRQFYLNFRKESPASVSSLLKRGMFLQPLQRGTSVLRDRTAEFLKLLMATLILLALIVGLNVAGLLLARTVARHRELAVRLAVGASPLLLARQMIVESLVLSLLAGLVALFVRVVTTPVALRLLPPIRNLDTSVAPISVDIGLDWRTLAFLLVLLLLTTSLFTLSPAAAMFRFKLDGVLRSTRSSVGLQGRRSFVALQIALCTFLLVSACELVRSFRLLAETPPGFATDSVATFTCNLEGYQNSHAFLHDLRNRILQLPGVVSAATSSIGVMRGHGQFANVAPAGQRVGATEVLSSNANQVSEDYFETMGIRLVSGRDFVPADAAKPEHTTPAKAIVNQAFVRRFFPASDPIGSRFGSAVEGSIAKPDCEIIGVVSDAKYRSLKDSIRPIFYTLQTDSDSFVLNVRTAKPPETIIEPVRQIAASIAPDLPFLEVNTLAREVSQDLAPERTTATLASLFAALAAVLAAVGAYGLLAYAVRLRSREIGIRIALGARSAHLFKLVAGETLVLGMAGILAGILLARVAEPNMHSLLYGLPPTDSVSFGIAGVLVAGIIVVATLGPVLQAIRIPPVEALRLDQ